MPTSKNLAMVFEFGVVLQVVVVTALLSFILGDLVMYFVNE